MYEDNRARPRLTWCDLFDNGELLCRIAKSQRHDEPATHFELLNQRRRDMLKCRCHDHGVERTAFRPPLITVAYLDTYIVIAEVFQDIRSGFGQWWDNLNGADLSYQTRKYCGLVTRTRSDFQNRIVELEAARWVISATINGCDIVWP